MMTLGSLRKMAGAMALLLILLSACRNDGRSDATPFTSAPVSPTLDSSSTEVGPLNASIEDGFITEIRGRVDKACRVSFGDGLMNLGDQPVTITGAEFGSVESVSVLGIMKLPQGSPGVGNPPGFPPREISEQWPRAREVVGSTLKPGEEASIVIGLQLESIDEGGVSGLTVEYEIDGRRYTDTDEDSFTAVANPKASCHI